MVTGRPASREGGDAVERAEFAGFYAASFQRLVGQLYAMTGDQSEAQDAVQEACGPGRDVERFERYCPYGRPMTSPSSSRRT